MSIDLLSQQHRAWAAKPCLRFMYTRWFNAIVSFLPSGPCVEIGAGIGKFKEHVPEAITLDIEQTPWTDIAGDAQALPFAENALTGLVLFDVLHHIPRPVFFFEEALRVLRPGGRCIIMDPYISPVSFLVYNYLHPEPVDTACDPFNTEILLSSLTPFDSNQAVSTILFFREKERILALFPAFKMVERQRLALLSYPFSGGFGKKALLPDGLIRWLTEKERYLSVLSSLLAFRALVVLEKE